MTMWFRPLLLCAALLAGSAAEAAQTVYRCGPGGREYSHMPCKEGRAVEVDDSRTATQQREGQGVADSQRRLVKQLESQRRQREAAATPQGAAGIKPLPAPAAAASAAKKSKSKKKGQQQATGDDDLPVPARVPAASAKKQPG
jgi:hypothetical protein